MNTSLFELFKIGIGPSSSHTVGPMRAALRFVRELPDLVAVTRIQVELYGSLAHTGVGHGTDRAILLGLLGLQPDTVDPAAIDELIASVRSEHTLKLNGEREISFDEPSDLLFRRDQMYPPHAEGATTHPNGVRLTAFGIEGKTQAQGIFYSGRGRFHLVGCGACA